MIDLGKRIFDARKQRGLTLDEVGQYVGVAKSTVRKWEYGTIKNMRRDKIKRLSEILDVSPAYLMGWTEDPDQYEKQDALIPVNIALSQNEQQLLARFRLLTPINQGRILERIDGMLEQSHTQSGNSANAG